MPRARIRKDLTFGDVLKLDPKEYPTPTFQGVRLVYLGVQEPAGHLGISVIDGTPWPLGRCEYLYEKVWIKDEDWPNAPTR